MSSPAFNTVHSIFSPVDASKLSGRYETTAEVKGKSVPVLRSVRHVREELVLQGSLTPKKAKPSSVDVDGLCDLFQAKASVTPNKKKRSSSSTPNKMPGSVTPKKKMPSSSKDSLTPSAPSARYAKKASEADSVKENLGQALKMVPKANAKSTRFTDDTKEAAVSPLRRSRRRTSSSDYKE